MRSSLCGNYQKENIMYKVQTFINWGDEQAFINACEFLGYKGIIGGAVDYDISIRGCERVSPNGHTLAEFTPVYIHCNKKTDAYLVRMKLRETVPEIEQSEQIAKTNGVDLDNPGRIKPSNRGIWG
jgi:hypothetical protein